MKFKVGDKVKIKEGCSGTIKGHTYPLYKTDKHGSPSNVLWAWDKTVIDACGCSCEENWILVSHNKTMAEKKIKYILKYDNGDDPYEEFATLDEVRKRIEELIEDGGLIMHSTRIYEVKSIAKIETKIIF